MIKEKWMPRENSKRKRKISTLVEDSSRKAGKAVTHSQKHPKK
jgi:hypothetical protein